MIAKISSALQKCFLQLFSVTLVDKLVKCISIMLHIYCTYMYMHMYLILYVYLVMHKKCFSLKNMFSIC